jgi:hypothetical protein
VIDAATGEVVSFTDEQLPYMDPPDPVVGEDEALAKAEDAAAQGGKAASSELRVTFDPADGTQSLVWQVAVGSDANGWVEAALVEVDALSGDATVLGRG